MSLTRRQLIGTTGATLLTAPFWACSTQAQSVSQIPENGVDGNAWKPLINFERLLEMQKLHSLKFTTVSGLRPCRTINNKTTVRLESDTSRPGKVIIHNYGHCGGGVTLSFGCASLLEKWLKTQLTINKSSKITVVGGGIIGLSTAYVLKRRGYENITIRTRQISSGDFENPVTVSDIAGGQFDAAGVNDISDQFINAETGKDRIKTTLRETLSVITEFRGQGNDPFRNNYVPVRNYITNPNLRQSALMDASDELKISSSHKGNDTLISGLSNGYPVIAPFEQMQRSRPASFDEPIMLGAYDTILINPQKVIKSILKYLALNNPGSPVVIQSGEDQFFSNFETMAAIDADVIINCTGLGGIITGGKNEIGAMSGVRGILAALDEKWLTENKLYKKPFMWNSDDKRYLYSGFGYMFPRADATILGGAWFEGLAKKSVGDFSDLSQLHPYSTSLPGVTDDDREKANLIVKAIGLFFLCRYDELKEMQGDLDGFFSGMPHFSCATNRSDCIASEV